VKINPGWRPFSKEIQRTENTTAQQLQQKSFSDMMHQQNEGANQEQLQRILQEIQMQGDRLSKSMTVRELRQYKLLVMKFLEETVRRGVQLRDTRGWDRRGRAKRKKSIKNCWRWPMKCWKASKGVSAFCTKLEKSAVC
jgi:uncharacterized protein YaaR (DUF327 family)